MRRAVLITRKQVNTTLGKGARETLTVQMSGRLDVQAFERFGSRKRKRRGKALPSGVITRANGPPPDLAKRLAVYIAESDRDMRRHQSPTVAASTAASLT